MENLNADNNPALQNAPLQYVIRVRGWLDPSWVEFYDDLTVSVAAHKALAPEVRLSGQLADQSALLGVLLALDHFGLTLLSVELVPKLDPFTQEGETIH